MKQYTCIYTLLLLLIPLCHRFPNGIYPSVLAPWYSLSLGPHLYTTRVHGSLTPTLSVYLNRNNERYRVNAKLIRSNYPLLEVRPSKVTALQMTGCHRCTRSATRIDRLCRCGGENMVFAFRSFECSLALLIQTRPLRTQWNFGLFENNEIFDTMVGRILSELSSCTYSLQRIYI